MNDNVIDLPADEMERAYVLPAIYANRFYVRQEEVDLFRLAFGEQRDKDSVMHSRCAVMVTRFRLAQLRDVLDAMLETLDSGNE